MRPVSPQAAFPGDGETAIRRAEGSEIDVLCDIDVDATTLFERAGLNLDLPAGHEFIVAERERWLRCLAANTTLLAVNRPGEPVGFAAVDVLDGEPYLEQLSVRTAFMRRGIGLALLNAAIDMTKAAGGRSLWLTTYGHLPWNRSFYERNGFEVIPTDDCGPEIVTELTYQQRWLPAPEQRLVMRRVLA